jgi:hypothetical protein
MIRLEIQPLALDYYSSSINFDFRLNAAPYRINSRGTGNSTQEIPPRRLAAGPLSRFTNIGRAAMGIAQARTDRRIVLAGTALAV